MQPPRTADDWPMTRVAGQHARRRVRVLALRTFLVLGFIVVVTLAAGLILGWTSPVFVGIEMAAIVAMKGLDKIAFPIIDRWDRGAEGEELVGKIVESLADTGWRPIHDVNMGRGNIDHILVGPGGLFTVETKSHRGRIRAANVEPAMLRQAYAQRKALERIAGVQVDALLVFSRAYLTPAVSRQRGVLVLPARMLAGHLARREKKLNVADVERIDEQLRAALEAA
jgi:hypothetical protein